MRAAILLLLLTFSWWPLSTMPADELKYSMSLKTVTGTPVRFTLTTQSERSWISDENGVVKMSADEYQKNSNIPVRVKFQKKLANLTFSKSLYLHKDKDLVMKLESGSYRALGKLLSHKQIAYIVKRRSIHLD